MLNGLKAPIFMGFHDIRDENKSTENPVVLVGQQPHGWCYRRLRCGGVRGAEIRVANPHEYWICSEKELPAGRLFFALGLCLKGAEITVCTPFVPICFKAFFVPHQERLLAD